MGCFSAPSQQTGPVIPGQQNTIAALLNELVPFRTQAPPQYPGERLAGFQPLQQQAFNQAGGGFDYLNQATQPFNFDQFSSSLRNQAQGLFGDLSDDILTTYGSAGAADSGLAQKALGEQARQLSTNLAATLAPYQFQGYQTGVNANLGAAGLQPSLTQGLYGLGAQQQVQRQAELDLSRRQFEEQGPLGFLYNPAYEQSIRLAGLPIESISTTSPAGLGYSALTGFAGGLGQGLGSIFNR